MIKNGKNKQSKAERQLKVVENAAKNEAQERMAAPATLEIVKEDQSIAKPEDQKQAGTGEPTTTKKAKKASPTVTSWKAQKAFPLDWVITEVSKDNPKRKDAARRFSYYEEGMTCQQYVDVTGKHEISKALAVADIRWDHVKGFITVVDPQSLRK